MSRSLKRTQKRTQSKQRGGKSKKNNPWLQQLAKAKENNTTITQSINEQLFVQYTKL